MCLVKVNAQENVTISFETRENYSLGLIVGQNGWITNPDYSSFMLVSDNESTDGTYSLYFKGDPNGSFPNNSVAHAVYNLAGLTGNVTFTADIFIEFGDEISDSEFGLILQSPTEGLLTSRLAFFGVDILVLNTNPADPATLTFQLADTYPTDQWFELKNRIQF